MSLNQELIQKRCQEIADSLKRLEEVKDLDHLRQFSRAITALL